LECSGDGDRRVAHARNGGNNGSVMKVVSKKYQYSKGKLSKKYQYNKSEFSKRHIRIVRYQYSKSKFRKKYWGTIRAISVGNISNDGPALAVRG
jgi:hypothetical protein